MKFGIGIDCEEIFRFKKVGLKKVFLNKVLTKKEIGYCKSKSDPFPHIAIRFAGKEAVIKAFSNFNKRLFFSEIEILNNKNGAPYVILKDDKMNKKFNIQLSLSHSKDNAIAFAIVTRGCENG